ncbi:histidine triad (HIT) family protein [Motilibacter rhizosphaerae]|uniref:Histidine triad (HIT) family protein n=1 Tax=Motilibacter rhizosphaerae TaxID=598652 RepID=A0A4Q7NTL3_9ACTN|nr:HIT domain-containing protein [Motilibacter rhizosphaerae]RZS89732.1 histidine triad (HIT) family protein [Motilibacter rhizosphaerae]
MTTSPVADCLFCRIVAGEVPSTEVASSAGAYAFRDIDPKAPTHVLVVPRTHAPDLAALAVADPAGLAAVGELVGEVARAEGLEAYRTVFNTGAGAGQTVFHAHAHVIGGRDLGWPPG